MNFFWYMLELCFKASASGWRWVGWALIKVSIVDWKCYWWPDPCSQAALNSCPTSWFSPPLHFHLHVVVFDWVDQLVCIRRLCPRIGNGGDSLLVQYHLLFVRQEDFKLAVDDLLNFSLWIILCVALWHKLRPTDDQDCGSSVAQLLPVRWVKTQFPEKFGPGEMTSAITSWVTDSQPGLAFSITAFGWIIETWRKVQKDPGSRVEVGWLVW